MRTLTWRDEDVADVGGVDEFYERRSDARLSAKASDVLPVPTNAGARCLMIFSPFSVRGMSVRPVCNQGPQKPDIEELDVVSYVSSFNLVVR